MTDNTIPCTKDGVPVTECTEFWVIDLHGIPSNTSQIDISNTSWWWAIFSDWAFIDESFGDKRIPISECYSTIEALKEAEDVLR